MEMLDLFDTSSLVYVARDAVCFVCCVCVGEVRRETCVCGGQRKHELSYRSRECFTTLFTPPSSRPRSQGLAAYSTQRHWLAQAVGLLSLYWLFLCAASALACRLQKSRAWRASSFSSSPFFQRTVTMADQVLVVVCDTHSAPAALSFSRFSMCISAGGRLVSSGSLARALQCWLQQPRKARFSLLSCAYRHDGRARERAL